jgi:nicotinamide-nucleotide amidase
MTIEDKVLLAEKVGKMLLSKGLLLVTAESCTGGGVAETVTTVPGCSNWFERGFVTYSNRAKQEMLNVSSGTLNTYGAVSEQTALEMAVGALNHSHATVSLAVTGIAGPDGGSPEKPVGLVWFAWALKESRSATISSFSAKSQLFKGDRTSIREQSITFALNGLFTI